MKKHLYIMAAFICCLFILAGRNVNENRNTPDHNFTDLDVPENTEFIQNETPEQEEVEAAPVVPDDDETSTYTYSPFNQTMYANRSVNIRNLPMIDGDQIGSLSYAQEVTVTGRCIETGWYRIDYENNEAFVSDRYLVSENPATETASAETSAAIPPVIETPSETTLTETQAAPITPIAETPSETAPTETPAATITPVNETPATVAAPAETSNIVNNPTPSDSNTSSSSSVTIPDHEESGENLVWVPVHGGTKYHCNSSCSNMIDPMQVTIETAIANGYEACRRCYK